MKDFEKIIKALKKSEYANFDCNIVYACEMNGHEIYWLMSKIKGKVGLPHFCLS